MISTTGKGRIGRRILTYLSQIEENLLSLLLFVMIILSCGRILFRFLSSGGLLWADPLLRYLVLWTGLLGAAMATSHGKHISLDIVGYLLPPGIQSWTILLNHLFSTVVCGFLTWAACLFIISEKEFGTAGLMNIPSYQWNLIFPIAFGLITFRFLCKTVISLRSIVTNEPPPQKPISP